MISSLKILSLSSGSFIVHVKLRGRLLVHFLNALELTGFLCVGIFLWLESSFSDESVFDHFVGLVLKGLK